MTDEAWNIGPGVREAISANGAEPRSDEQYVVMEEGRKISRTFASDGIYFYYQEDNRTFRSPFR